MKQIVYILRSLKKSDEYYVGLCTDMAERLSDHNSGKSPHTSKSKPWEIVFQSWFADPVKAAAFEKYLKSGSGRAFAAKRFR